MAFSGKSTSRKSRHGLLAKTAMLVAATAVGNGDVASASSAAGEKVRELDDREKHEIRRLSTLLQNVDHENAWSEDSRDIIESLQTRDEERHRKLLQEREVFAEREKRRIRESRRLEELKESSIFYNDSISGSQSEKHSRRGFTRRTIRADGSGIEDGRMLKPTSDASIDIKRRNGAAEQKVAEEYSTGNETEQEERDLGSKGGKTLRQRTWTTPRGRGFTTNRQPASMSRGYYYGDVDDFFQDDYFYSESSEDTSRHWVLPPDTDLDPDTIICIENGQRKLVSSRHWYYPGGVDPHDDDDDDDHIYYNSNYYAVGAKSGKSMKSGKSSSGGYYVYGGGGGNGLTYLDYDHDDSIDFIDQPQTVVVGGKTGKQSKGGKRGKVLACSEVIIAQPAPPSSNSPSSDPPSGGPPFGGPPSGGPPSGGPPSGPTAPTPNMSPAPTPVGFVSDMPTLDCPDGCPDCDPNSPLQCPPRDMKAVCDKHNDALYPPGDAREGERVANFRDCYDMCKPSFCCIHDSLSKEYAPSCAQEYENCFLYYPCYIIWWKLHDTIGPATYLRVEQDEDFYNVDFEFLTNDFANDREFFQQLFGHHFDDDNAPTDDTFENEDNW